MKDSFKNAGLTQDDFKTLDDLLTISPKDEMDDNLLEQVLSGADEILCPCGCGKIRPIPAHIKFLRNMPGLSETHKNQIAERQKKADDMKILKGKLVMLKRAMATAGYFSNTDNIDPAK